MDAEETPPSQKPGERHAQRYTPLAGPQQATRAWTRREEPRRDTRATHTTLGSVRRKKCVSSPSSSPSPREGRAQLEISEGEEGWAQYAHLETIHAHNHTLNSAILTLSDALSHSHSQDRRIPVEPHSQYTRAQTTTTELRPKPTRRTYQTTTDQPGDLIA